MAYLDFEDEEDIETSSQLPIFEGCAVDEYHRQFKKVTWTSGQAITQTIPFSSKQGRKLLRAWTRAQGRMLKR